MMEKVRSLRGPLRRRAAGGYDEDAARSRHHDQPEQPPTPPKNRWRDGAERARPPGVQRELRMTWRSRSRTFLRKVFRLTPRSSAARIWLPRVAASAAPIS